MCVWGVCVCERDREFQYNHHHTRTHAHTHTHTHTEGGERQRYLYASTFSCFTSKILHLITRNLQIFITRPLFIKPLYFLFQPISYTGDYLVPSHHHKAPHSMQSDEDWLTQVFTKKAITWWAGSTHDSSVLIWTVKTISQYLILFYCHRSGEHLSINQWCKERWCTKWTKHHKTVKLYPCTIKTSNDRQHIHTHTYTHAYIYTHTEREREIKHHISSVIDSPYNVSNELLLRQLTGSIPGRTFRSSAQKRPYSPPMLTIKYI